MTQLGGSHHLNDSQLRAVEYCDGPALVIAGAGSGKTRVLVKKIVHLINIGYEPSSIMALTFTNKAANEMRERIRREIGSKAKYIRMGTFHSVFSRILRMHADLLGYSENFSIYNTNDTKSKIKSIIKDLNLDDKQYNPSVIQKKISTAKNNLILPNMYIQNGDIQRRDAEESRTQTGLIYLKYFQALKQNNAMDFDDLLLFTNILFRDYPEVLAFWQDQIDYLLVDEYQDTNVCQYLISRKIAEKKNKIFVVGDDAQSIYSFRGANIENILNFQRNFPDAKIFKLEENYRSTKTIVNAANELIKYNKSQHHKDIFSNREQGELIDVYRAETPDLEANRVAHIIANTHYSKNTSFKDFAVLYRKNSQSRVLEQALRRNSIPFRIWGGLSFFNYKEILDITAYFRLIINEKDDEAVLRVINYPKRKIGDTTIDKIKTIARDNSLAIIDVVRDKCLLESSGLSSQKINNITRFADLVAELKAIEQSEDMSLSDKVKEIIYRSGIHHELLQDKTDEGKQKQDNMNELVASVDDYMISAQENDENPTLAGYISEIALYTDLNEMNEDDADKVTLMTIHSSKGLEFPNVFIVGVEENIFPSIMSKSDERDIEEERRLMYVAITRAMDFCYISYVKERYNFKNNSLDFVRPSRFITELPANLIKTNNPLVFNEIRNFAKRNIHKEVESAFNVKNYTNTNQQDSFNSHNVDIATFKEGDRIEHKNFGKGTIVEFSGSGNDKIAFVKFDSGETKRLLMRFAKLILLND